MKSSKSRSISIASLLIFCLINFSLPLFAQVKINASPSSNTTFEKKHPLEPRDYYRIPHLASLEISADGKWIAYTLSHVDTAKNKRISHIWMQSMDGKQSLQLTNGIESESSPKFSPDGKLLSFLSGRESEIGSQVWVLDRRGGEGKKITQIKGEIQDIAWSPDSKSLALAIQDPEPKNLGTSKTIPPIVLDRYHFKQDVEGFLTHRRTHLYIYHLESKKLDTLTRGEFDETDPNWSPDGSSIAFVSNRTEDPDKNSNTDIFTIPSHTGGKLKQITVWKGSNTYPRWSPDGKSLLYLQSTGEGNFIMYEEDNVLYKCDANGENAKALTASLSRPVRNPCWSRDGNTLGFLVEDDRKVNIAEIDLKTGKLSRYSDLENSISDLHTGSGTNWVGIISKPQQPGEVFSMDQGILRRLTFHQAEWLKNVEFATVTGFTSTSKDSTKVSNLLYTPNYTQAGKRLPLILFIHGGPVGEDEYDFDFTRQVLAEAGYLVLAVNYRGSSGRGVNYSKAIYGDWGNKEVMDLLGAVDELVKKGLADPGRLGIGGWSYGGILTNYTIASDPRFKAACSGAGSSLQLSMYGVDQYVLQYENELGAPWKNPEKWIALSYPFFKADKIKTPTLFMAGEKDFNVPSVGSEQMYQALKSLGVPTQLVIYPGQFHGISVPTYIVDRLDRYIVWYNKYLLAK